MECGIERHFIWTCNVCFGTTVPCLMFGTYACAGPRCFIIIIINERIQIQQKSYHRQPASETPVKWRFAGVPMMASLVDLRF